jgi:proteasome accessory factor A
VGWDFEDEHPDIDARGFTAEAALAPEVETHLVNAVLTNGARYYVDHAHPELSTPRVRRPRGPSWCSTRLPSWCCSGRCRPPSRSSRRARRSSSTRTTPIRKGNSYGWPREYLMDRQVPFSRIVMHVMPHFVSRQVYTGAGKVGTEAPGLTAEDVPFQLTQRADFFEEEVGLETTLKRPDRQHPRRAPRRRPALPAACT